MKIKELSLKTLPWQTLDEILGEAFYDRSPAAIIDFQKKYAEDVRCLGVMSQGKPSSLVIFREHADDVEIEYIGTAYDARRQGQAQTLLNYLLSHFNKTLRAETDDEAVGFYQKQSFCLWCGFNYQPPGAFIRFCPGGDDFL